MGDDNRQVTYRATSGEHFSPGLPWIVERIETSGTDADPSYSSMVMCRCTTAEKAEIIANAMMFAKDCDEIIIQVLDTLRKASDQHGVREEFLDLDFGRYLDVVADDVSKIIDKKGCVTL
jgi:hypothetical protein